MAVRVPTEKDSAAPSASNSTSPKSVSPRTRRVLVVAAATSSGLTYSVPTPANAPMLATPPPPDELTRMMRKLAVRVPV